MTSLDVSHLALVSIPRLAFGDPAIDQLMREGKPVVVTGSGLVQSSIDKWDISYLAENTGDSLFTVYQSRSQFLYSRKQVPGKELYNFQSQVTSQEVTFAQFAALLERPGTSDIESRPMYYLQQRLDSYGPALTKDIANWNWDWVLDLSKQHEWGGLTTNLFLVGEPGTITPLHFDEQENVFAQVQGRKQFVLYPPSDFCNLYPYPLSHPADRQSQVDILAPDTEKFPNFANATGHHAILDAGDVLYLPPCWWHHVSNPFELTISVNFWFTQGKNDFKNGGIELPLRDDTTLVSLRRNIEKLLNSRFGAKGAHDLFLALDEGGMLPTYLHPGVLEATSMLLHVLEPEEVTPFLCNLVRGRFRHLTLHPAIDVPQAL